MSTRKTIALSAIFLMVSPVSFGADSSACMDCHEADEFSGMSAADIVAGATDPGIPPHQRLADVSEADLQAIAAELSGG